MALYERKQVPYIVTAGGWARSGKGTSMVHLKSRLEGRGRSVALIDQGIKFRAIGEVAGSMRQLEGGTSALNNFIQSDRAQKSTLSVLAEVSTMTDTEVKARLYTPNASKAAGRVGSVPASHEVAVGLLRTQVQTATEAGTELILIDGRSIETHAKRFTEEGIAKFVMGWFFKCAPAIAARRSLGLFGEFEHLSAEEKEALLSEVLNISDRNKSDSLRAVDPLREPSGHAYHLDLSTYGLPGSEVPYKIANDILNHGKVALVDTSYTGSALEMTGPVTQLSMFCLFHRGPLSHADVGIGVVSSGQ